MSLQIFDELKQRIRSLPIDEFLKEAIQENEAELADLNITQLQQGKDHEGDDIDPAYTPFTKQIKAFKGQPTDKVTLEDTGDFYAGMFAEVRGKKVLFGSDDSKTTKIVKKYGGQVFGLTDENKAEASQELLKPELIEKTRNYMLK